MILGGGTWHNSDGCLQLYCSDNLADWRYVGVPLRSQGELDAMWEYPDLFRLDGK